MCRVLFSMVYTVPFLGIVCCLFFYFLNFLYHQLLVSLSLEGISFVYLTRTSSNASHLETFPSNSYICSWRYLFANCVVLGPRGSIGNDETKYKLEKENNQHVTNLFCFLLFPFRQKTFWKFESFVIFQRNFEQIFKMVLTKQEG